MYIWQATAAVGLLPLPVVVSAAGANQPLFVIFGLKLPGAASVRRLVTLQVRKAVVSVSGNSGVFHDVAMLTRSAYSVSRQIALAGAMVLDLIALIPKILAGAALLVFGPRELTPRMLVGWPWGYRI